jgi:hypothetical protein
MFMSRVSIFAEEIRREKSAPDFPFFLSFFVPFRLTPRKEITSVPRTSYIGEKWDDGR